MTITTNKVNSSQLYQALQQLIDVAERLKDVDPKTEEALWSAIQHLDKIQQQITTKEIEDQMTTETSEVFEELT
jgi:hypothetical protein